MKSTTPTKLPLWRTVIDAHVETFGMIGTLARLAWPWLLVLIAAMAAVDWFLWPLEQRAIAEGRLGTYTFLFLPTFLPLLIGCFVAVPWHRALIAGEPVTARTALELAPISLRYFSWAVLLSAFVLAPAIAAYAVVDLSIGTDAASAAGAHAAPVAEEREIETMAADNSWLIGLSVVVVLVLTFVGPFAILLYVPTRLTLILPAIALSSPHADAGTIWRATSGNFWRLYFGSFLSLLVPMTFALLQFAVEGDISTREAFVASAVLADALALVAGMVGVSFLSLAYRHLLVDDGAAPDARGPY